MSELEKEIMIMKIKLIKRIYESKWQIKESDLEKGTKPKRDLALLELINSGLIIKRRTSNDFIYLIPESKQAIVLRALIEAGSI